MERLLQQLWSFFENSPKKTAAYIKAKEQIQQVKLNEQTRAKATTKLQLACRTRQLSTGKAVSGVYNDLPALLQTMELFKVPMLQHLGSLRKCMTLSLFGTIYILKAVIPVLDAVSRAFQKGAVSFSSVAPNISYAKAELQAIRVNKDPLNDLERDLAAGGRLNVLGVELVLNDTSKKHLETLLVKYTDALVAHLDVRFEATLPLLDAFGILFDPTKLPEQNPQNLGNMEKQKCQ